MKKNIIAIMIFLGIGCFLLWWYWQSSEKGLVNQVLITVSTNATTTTEKPNRTPEIAQKPASAENVAAPSAGKEMKSNKFYQEWLNATKAPIDFYGKVVDENSNSLVGANITFHWDEDIMGHGHKDSTIYSDAEGLFSFHAVRGTSLDVAVSKKGFYSPRLASQGFNYVGNNHFSPDPLNPMVFKLKAKTKGESLIEVRHSYRVPRNGKSINIDLTSGKTVADLSGDLVIQCLTKDHDKRPGEKFDWHCEVTFPKGGLLFYDEEFPFFAPPDGYIPSTEIIMSSDDAKWQNHADLKFFFHLSDGRYGRMTFTMIAHGDHFCMIDSLLNPTYSQNLEPQ